MNRTNRAATARTRSTISRSAYSAPGIASPPGLSRISNGHVRDGFSINGAQNYSEAVESAIGISQPPAINQINNTKLRKPLTADELFLRDILNEAKTDPLYQEPNPLITSEVESITDHSFASMVWVPRKGNGGPQEYHGWPKFDKLSKGLGFRALTKPDKFSEALEGPNAPGTHKDRPHILSNPSKTHRKPTDNSIAPRAWSPPPAFIPGVPFQAHTSVQSKGQENNPQIVASSGGFPPNGRVGEVQEFSKQYPMHGRYGGAPQFRTETRDQYTGKTQGQARGSLPKSHVSLPEIRLSRRGMNFRPAETANAAIAQLHSSMSASQLRNISRSSNKNLHNDQFMANFCVYNPLNKVPTLGHEKPLGQAGISGEGNNFLSGSGVYMETGENQMDNTDGTSSIHSFGSLARLRTKTRGIYIKNVPAHVSLSQVCDNIRGGAIDRISFRESEGKIDVAVHFVSADAAKAYKHWTNRVGGIWWSPANHGAAFPSFTTFIGPEGYGHDRLKDMVISAIASDGATRCIVIVGLPNNLTTERVIEDLRKGVYPSILDVESANTIKGGNDSQNKDTSVIGINFASIETALNAKKVLARCQTYQNASVYFAPDDCAGPIQDLAEKWNKELFEAEVMSLSGNVFPA